MFIMGKFSKLFNEARKGVRPWDRVPEEAINKVSVRIDNADVREAIHMLDELIKKMRSARS